MTVPYIFAHKSHFWGKKMSLKQGLRLICEVQYTVSRWQDARLASAHIPLFGLKVIIKYDVAQCELCFGISPIPHFYLDLPGNALHAYARGYSKSVTCNLWFLCKDYECDLYASALYMRRFIVSQSLMIEANFSSTTQITDIAYSSENTAYKVWWCLVYYTTSD